MLIRKERSMQYRTCPEKPTLLKCFSLHALFWEKKLRGQHLLVQNHWPPQRLFVLFIICDRMHNESSTPGPCPQHNSSRSRKHLQCCSCSSDPLDSQYLLRHSTDICSWGTRIHAVLAAVPPRGTPLLHSSENENKRCSFPSLYFCL